MVVVTEGSYTRYAVHLTCRNMSRMSETDVQPVCISIKGRKPYPTMNTAFYSVTKWGLPKLECSQELWVQALKIQYGNGAAVVVRAY